MKRSITVALLGACAVAVWVGVRGTGYSVQADGDDLLPGLIQGCKDAATNVRSGKGTITCHSTTYSYGEGVVKALETEGTYTVAFEGDKYRISGDVLCLKNEIAHTPNYPVAPGMKRPFDVACDGRRILEFDRLHGTAEIGTAETSMRSVASSIVMKQVLPVKSLMSGHGIHRIDLYAPGGTGLRVMRRESLDSHECIVVSCAIEMARLNDERTTISYEIWVDPERGFTVPRVRMWAEGGTLPGKILVLEDDSQLRRYGDGLWGPARHTHIENGPDGNGGTRVYSRVETTYGSDYQLNVPVTADDLTIKMPPGAFVTDRDAQGGAPSP